MGKNDHYEQPDSVYYCGAEAENMLEIVKKPVKLLEVPVVEETMGHVKAIADKLSQYGIKIDTPTCRPTKRNLSVNSETEDMVCKKKSYRPIHNPNEIRDTAIVINKCHDAFLKQAEKLEKDMVLKTTDTEDPKNVSLTSSNTSADSGLPPMHLPEFNHDGKVDFGLDVAPYSAQALHFEITLAHKMAVRCGNKLVYISEQDDFEKFATEVDTITSGAFSVYGNWMAIVSKN